jgi:hypothetical protein
MLDDNPIKKLTLLNQMGIEELEVLNWEDVVRMLSVRGWGGRALDRRNRN